MYLEIETVAFTTALSARQTSNADVQARAQSHPATARRKRHPSRHLAPVPPGRLVIAPPSSCAKGDSSCKLKTTVPGPTLISEAARPRLNSPRELTRAVSACPIRVRRLEHLYGAAHRFELTRATPRGMIVTLEIPFQVEAAPIGPMKKRQPRTLRIRAKTRSRAKTDDATGPALQLKSHLRRRGFGSGDRETPDRRREIGERCVSLCRACGCRLVIEDAGDAIDGMPICGSRDCRSRRAHDRDDGHIWPHRVGFVQSAP